MKRFGQWTVAIGLGLAVFLTACGRGTSPGGSAGSNQSAAPVHIVFSTFNDGIGVDKKLVDDFNASHPNIQVEYRAVASSDQHDRFVTWLGAQDSSLDVLALDVVWPAEFAAAGWIRPLDEFMDASFNQKLKDDFLPSTVEVDTVGGKLYAIPWNTNGGLLFYRKDILEKAGLKPPQTWEELLADARIVQAQDHVKGYVGQLARYEGLTCNAQEIFASYGGGFYDANGQPVVDSPANRKALAMLVRMQKDIMPEGITTYQEKQSADTFLSGNAVFLRNWTYVWALAEKPDSAIKGKVGMVPLPAGEGGRHASTLGGWNLAISAYSKHPKEAWEFIRWMTDSHAQKVKAVEGGRLPTLKSLYRDPDVLAKNPAFKDWYEVLINGVSRPKTANYAKVSDAIQEEISLALSGQKTSDQALADLQQRLMVLSK